MSERDTIFLCWLLLHCQLSTQPTHSARSAQSHLALSSSESQPSSSEAATQLTAFSQISAHASGVWRHPNTLVPIPIWDFYFDISEWHILSMRAWTPVLMLHLTNPCVKWKVLSLTKPKGKIYKTKSLCNYITSPNKYLSSVFTFFYIHSVGFNSLLLTYLYVSIHIFIDIYNIIIIIMQPSMSITMLSFPHLCQRGNGEICTEKDTEFLEMLWRTPSALSWLAQWNRKSEMTNSCPSYCILTESCPLSKSVFV